MRRQSSLDRRRKSRRSAEKDRQKNNEPHLIHYFHELDDGYSLLAVQLLEQLTAKYDVDLHCHIASRETSNNIPEPNLLNSDIVVVPMKAVTKAVFNNNLLHDKPPPSYRSLRQQRRHLPHRRLRRLDWGRGYRRSGAHPLVVV